MNYVVGRIAIVTEIAEKLLPEMIFRDVNHPCIFVWANGNEEDGILLLTIVLPTMIRRNVTSFIRGRISMAWIHAITPNGTDNMYRLERGHKVL